MLSGDVCGLRINACEILGCTNNIRTHNETRILQNGEGLLTIGTDGVDVDGLVWVYGMFTRVEHAFGACVIVQAIGKVRCITRIQELALDQSK